MSTGGMMIAAITKAHEGLLVTRNIKEFDFLTDLGLLNPWVSVN